MRVSHPVATLVASRCIALGADRGFRFVSPSMLAVCAAHRLSSLLVQSIMRSAGICCPVLARTRSPTRRSAHLTVLGVPFFAKMTTSLNNRIVRWVCKRNFLFISSVVMMCVCVCVWMFSFYLLLVSLSFKCRRISSRRCKPPVSPTVKTSAAIVVIGSMALENRSVRCPRIIKIAWSKKYMFANRRNCSIRLLHGQQTHGEYFLVTIALSQN